MVRQLDILAAAARRQAGLVSRRQLLAYGITKRQIETRTRRGEWHRVTTGVYDLRAGSESVDRFDHARLRSAWTGLLATDPHGIAAGACALALLGAWGLPTSLRPEVCLPGAMHTPGAAGVTVRRFSKPLELVELHGRRLASPVTALIQAVPEWPRDVVVAVLDSALNRGLIAAVDLERIRTGVRGRRGAAQLHPWWPLVDGRAGSPVETKARLQCLDAGLPPPRLQVPILDATGWPMAFADLGWLRTDGIWVVVEIDGRSIHTRPEALFRDRARQNAIAQAGGYLLLRFTAKDVRERRIANEVAHALRR
ncbi:type IV toxin-antitoxin system AbiEi family antitoxin domain-containing protein [Pseudactinotalea sp. HY158]|uniref:type IV toxin-antitoxin system AbiEi family antitoxin domain-containing protein n=1 Tax=Pseudactinotalea sp. HY158 TaxID=2654547 RepID=UPI00129CC84C|nr:type IV toxin-antitoxin system AbiEi family antitoxin domain-containing protein [Pseudactinotalea sp. HY158]QGH70364.1 hypothetical protein GCE65_13340 [Pseudactinotalea sp. HY158]